MGDDIFPWPGNKGVPGVGRVTNMEGETIDMVVGVGRPPPGIVYS